MLQWKKKIEKDSVNFWHGKSHEQVIVCDIKQPNHESCFPPFFPQNFLSLIFLSFGLLKSLFSFSPVQTEKNSQKKMEETKFVVWWFDVMNKVLSTFWSNELVTQYVTEINKMQRICIVQTLQNFYRSQ